MLQVSLSQAVPGEASAGPEAPESAPEVASRTRRPAVPHVRDTGGRAGRASETETLDAGEEPMLENRRPLLCIVVPFRDGEVLSPYMPAGF